MPRENPELDPETQRVLEALEKKGVSRTVTCARALAVADELGIERLAMGDALNKLNIRIDACQLGCFGRKGDS